MSNGYNGFPKIQVNVNIRESQGQIIETSTLLNLRGDDLTEVIGLFHSAREQLNGLSNGQNSEDNGAPPQLIKDTTPKRTCPECGGLMLLRTARNGKNPGGKFYGCSRYPMCNATQPC